MVALLLKWERRMPRYQIALIGNALEKSFEHEAQSLLKLTRMLTRDGFLIGQWAGIGGGDDDPGAGGGRKKFNPAQAGAFKHLANATPEEVAQALRDPDLYAVYSQSLKTGTDADQAAANLQDLGAAIARHATAERGTYKLHSSVSDAVWALPENLRGILVEKTLGGTQYKGYFNAGQLDRGFFPDIDFTLKTAGSDVVQRVSVKSVNPFAKAYEQQLTVDLPLHVETLVTGTVNTIKAGERAPSTILDIRVPRGASTPQDELATTLRDLIPSDMRRYIKVKVSEF